MDSPSTAAGQYDGLSLNPLEQMFVKVKEMCIDQVLTGCRSRGLSQPLAIRIFCSTSMFVMHHEFGCQHVVALRGE